jgi:glyoxylase-like metal-dependent hydrolase (beta-lactamase superfamily II)
MTLDGTKSYVLGFPGADSVVVVDPGPDHAGHLAALAGRGRVELILVTHRHADHTAGVDTLQRLSGAPVRAVLPEFCRGAEPLLGPGTGGREVIRAAGLEIWALATPGHTSDSVSFFLPDDGPHGAMATGDTILGRGTTILDFPDGTLGDYLASLDTLGGFGHAALLPAHGPVGASLVDVVDQYRVHRLERLEQIRDALAALGHTAGGPAPTVAEVADAVYSDVDPTVRGAAEQSVAAQLEYLLGGRSGR